MVDAISYARKSPDDKEDTKTSINNQLEDNRFVANNKGWNLVKEFVDKDVTGSDRERKGFSGCIKFAIDNRNIRLIIMKDQTRFARDAPFFMDTLKDLEAYGIKVYSRQKGDFLRSDDLGDGIMAVVAQYKITEGRKNAKELYERKVREKLPPFIAPFGYQNHEVYDQVLKKKIKNWVIVKKEAEKVRLVCEDFVNNVRMRDTLKALKIDKSSYYRIVKNFKNGIYIGYIYYENKIKDSNKKIISVDKIRYKGLHQPIVSEELYNRVNKN